MCESYYESSIRHCINLLLSCYMYDAISLASIAKLYHTIELMTRAVTKLLLETRWSCVQLQLDASITTYYQIIVSFKACNNGIRNHTERTAFFFNAYDKLKFLSHCVPPESHCDVGLGNLI